MADEVYEHAVFPGRTHHRLADRLRDRTISLSSAGKLFSLTGWRVGWALAPRDLALKVSNAHTALTYSAPTPLQKGVAEALKAEDGSFDGVPFTFGRNAEMLAAALTARGLDVFPPEGGYFLCANCHEPAMGFVGTPRRRYGCRLHASLGILRHTARGGHVGALHHLQERGARRPRVRGARAGRVAQ